MKLGIALALILAPLAAQASFGPEVTQASTHGVHLTQLAWTEVDDGVKPGCTDPTPQPVLLACATMVVADQ